jgi:glycosyltransferase involved in cell wall biosynthesis
VGRAYGLDSRVCYLGVDAQFFRPLGLPRERFVVGMGSVTLSKGIDRALRALATIPPAGRPDLIWIANIAPARYRTEIEALARSLGVCLRLCVGIPDPEVIDLLNRAAVMIYTSRLEPFGFAPLEANACETPVVAIAEGGARETIQHGVNGLLVDDDDSERLGASVLELLDRPEHARALGKRAREHVLRDWTWDSAVDRLEEHLINHG